MPISTRTLIRALLLFIPGFLLGQQAIFFSQNVSTTVAATPGLVNAISTGSTLTNAMGTTANTCATRTLCINFVDPTPGATLGVVSVQYSSSPANSISVTDDKSNTWTCLTASSASSSKIINTCYAPNMASATSQVKVLFSGLSTQVSVRLSQFYNIATASPVDGTPSSNTGTGGAGANDLTAGSTTPTQANDLIYMVVCRTGTPAATSFTAGSTQNNTTWELLTTDIKDGCADQIGVQTVAGAINPQMTTTAGSTFAAQAVAFKSATAGTAPTGMYTRKIQGWSTPDPTSGNFALQFPSKGNLLVNAINCGAGAGPMVPTSITDGTNSWSLTGPVYVAGPHSISAFYAANAAANSSGLITQNTTATGDCTFKLYDIVGAAAAPFSSRQYSMYTQGVSQDDLTVGTFRAFNMLPGNTNGLTIFSGNWQTNTSVGLTAPSGANFDGVFYGGEGLDGPNPMDQNGMWGHVANSSNALLTVTPTMSAASSTGAWIVEADSFMSATGSTGQYAQVVTRSKNNTAATATTIAVTVPAITQHNAMVCAVGDNNSRTITKICTDGGTCAAGNSFTQATSAACSSGTLRGDIWYLLDLPAGGSTTVTATYSATATNREMTCWEVKRPSGSWAFDLAANTASIASGTAVSPPAITNTGTTGFQVGYVLVGNAVTRAPAATDDFVAGGFIYATTTTNATASSVLDSNASHQATFTDASSGDTGCGSTAAIK